MAMAEGRTAESFYYAPLRISCREAFSGKRIHDEISPLRFASVEMTMGKVAFARERRCCTEAVFILSGRPWKQLRPLSNEFVISTGAYQDFLPR
jgi:hypothetical protein